MTTIDSTRQLVDLINTETGRFKELVVGVGIGVQERHGDGCYLVGLELAGGGADRILVQRNQHLTIEAGPLRHLDDVPGAHRPVGFDP